jgi:hypothetical protein
MSLINDALKRARQAQPENLAPADGPWLRPVERAPRGARPDFLMLALIGVVLVLAGVLLLQWFHSGDLIVRAKTIPAAPAPEAIHATPASVQTAAVAQPATNLAVAVEPAKPPPIVYKLQSIFYFPKNPSAVINGKTVHEGTVVGEARVVAIGQESATILMGSGETNILELQ